MLLKKAPFVFWILGNMVIWSWNWWQWKQDNNEWTQGSALQNPVDMATKYGKVPGLQFSCRWLEMVSYLLSKRPFLHASMDITERIIAFPRRLLFDRDYFWYLASLLLVGELVFNGLIINKVACKWIIFYTPCRPLSHMRVLTLQTLKSIGWPICKRWRGSWMVSETTCSCEEILDLSCKYSSCWKHGR